MSTTQPPKSNAPTPAPEFGWAANEQRRADEARRLLAELVAEDS